MKTTITFILITLATLTALILPATALAQDPDKTGGNQERAFPAQPFNLN